MDVDIPSRIGRYVVDRLAGAGAMGFVYLGKDTELDRAVAIKTLRDLGMDPASLATFLERFKNEARAAARLHHPSIVQVYDVGEDPAVGPYLVFEYVPGTTLKEVLRSRGPLAPLDLLRLAEQVADALDTAHAAGIVHRDVKPDNLLTTSDGRVKLADFGVARIPDAALTREGQFLGTPCYAAPETLGGGEYGRKTDLFSFAAVLYEVASGTRAFPGDDAVAVAHKVIHDEPPPPSEVARGPKIPAVVDEVVLRGLSKDPTLRYESCGELAEDLRAAFIEAGVVEEEVREPSARVPLARGSNRPRAEGGGSRIAFWAVLAGGLAVGVALVFAVGRVANLGDEPDAGTGAPDSGMAGSETSDDRPRDGGPLAIPIALDAGRDGGPAQQTLSAHEREERAKDLIDEARRLGASGDVVGARARLEQARELDPDNPDIEEELGRLHEGS